MAGLATHLVAVLALSIAQGSAGMNSGEGKWPDERRPPSSTDASRLDPTLEMLRIAQCIVDRSRTRATNLLSTEVGSSAEARVEGATRHSFEKCMVAGKRSEERRGGKAGVSTCRTRWSPSHYTTNNNT